nr:MAG TPA: hypothetical protein [Caudoviricetes sp.]
MGLNLLLYLFACCVISTRMKGITFCGTKICLLLLLTQLGFPRAQ